MTNTKARDEAWFAWVKKHLLMTMKEMPSDEEIQMRRLGQVPFYTAWSAAIAHVLKAVGEFDRGSAVKYWQENHKSCLPRFVDGAEFQHDQIIKKIKGDVG